jgi:transporter, betaine/carnitine/choline family
VKKQGFRESLKLIDKKVLIISWIALLALSLPIILFPEASGAVVGTLNGWVLDYLGAPYMWFGIFCLIFCIYIIVSRYGKVHLGDKGEKPEFKTFSWAAMLFCCGVGAGVLYWGFIEWGYYFQAPPLGLEYGTWQAGEMAPAYGFFHWGPTAWAIYAVSACTFGYIMFVRKSNVLKCSEGCRGLLGKKVDGPLGKVIDVFFIFGIVGAVATSLGLANPLVTACICTLFGIEATPMLQIIILLIIVAMFGLSAYSGLNKGIKFLSDSGVWLALLLIAFVFVVGDTKFIYDTTTTAIGLMAQNFIRMSTWLDSIGLSGFPQSWTVFYWAWWAGYAPFLGMFIARISKGRTVKSMVAGSLLFGSAGCILFFGVLGNYGLDLQLSGAFDVVNSLSEIGPANTIVEILLTLPFGKIAVILVALLCFVFAANSYDSASYIIAANSQIRVENGESVPILRLIWAFGLSLIPIGFIILDAPLATLQTATLVLSIPIAFIIVIIGISYLKMVKEDILSGVLDQPLVVRNFSELTKTEISAKK